MVGSLRRHGRLLLKAAKSWAADDAFQHSAALAFYMLFSFAPLLIIAITVTGLFFGEEAAQGQLVGTLEEWMGPEGAAEVIWAKEIKNAPEPEKARRKFIEEYERNFATPYLAASLRLIDDVIFPSETRIKIIQALRMLRKKKKAPPERRHGIMPV